MMTARRLDVLHMEPQQAPLAKIALTATWLKWIVLALVMAPTPMGCKRHSRAESATGKGAQTIQNIGSDTMVNVAQAWAEDYAQVEPQVSVEVSGGGTGVGVAALINGTADIANCSRRIDPKEVEEAKKTIGKVPKEYLVGFDGLAVYVHKNNPLDELSLEELSDIYRENGPTNKWSELGVSIPGARMDEIIRISRQNNSGTYQYFRETVAGKKADFKLGSLDMNGSKEVVELVAQTPGAIGYSGLGYATPAVKVLKISKTKGNPGVAPNLATIQNSTYPISRPLYMYTPGEPGPAASKYMAWVMSAEGQSILRQTGYIPLTQ